MEYNVIEVVITIITKFIFKLKSINGIVVPVYYSH